MQTEYACLCMQVFIHMHINTIIFLPVNKFYVLHIYLSIIYATLCVGKKLNCYFTYTNTLTFYHAPAGYP